MLFNPKIAGNSWIYLIPSSLSATNNAPVTLPRAVKVSIHTLTITQREKTWNVCWKPVSCFCMAAPPCTNFDLPPICLLLLFSSPLWTIIHPTTNQPSAPFISQLAACQLIGKLLVCFLNAVVLLMIPTFSRPLVSSACSLMSCELEDKRVRLCLKGPWILQNSLSLVFSNNLGEMVINDVTKGHWDLSLVKNQSGAGSARLDTEG